MIAGIVPPSIVSATPQDDEAMDLRKWSQEGVPGHGSWSVSADGTSVSQSTNGKPTFFVSPQTIRQSTIRGKIKVPSGDNDYVGFVFGFRAPSKDDIHQYSFYLFDWKQGNQTDNSFGGLARAGMRVIHVNARKPDPDDVESLFWPDKAQAGFRVLAKKQGGKFGWHSGKEYTFALSHSGGRVQIRMAGGQFGAGQTIFSISGQFRGGRFGFYNYSQSGVTYSGFFKGQYQEHIPGRFGSRRRRITSVSSLAIDPESD